MPTTDATPNERHLFWQGQLERWQHSGQSQAAYCRDHGLRAPQFRWWKRRPAAGAREAVPTMVNFIPVEELTPSAPAPLPAASVSERLDSGVRLWAGGVRIELAPGFHRATLRAALEVLGA